MAGGLVGDCQRIVAEVTICHTTLMKLQYVPESSRAAFARLVPASLIESGSRPEYRLQESSLAWAAGDAIVVGLAWRILGSLGAVECPVLWGSTRML